MPALTMANQISLVKKLSRADSAYLTTTDTDDDARMYINMGVEEFVKKAHGLSKEDFIDVTPVFDTRTTWAVRVTIDGGTNDLTATDIAITGTDANDTTGTAVATALQVTLRAAIGGGANATVVWSTTEWTFVIDAIDSTSITIEAPTTITNIDATEMLFGRSGLQTGTTWTSGFPQDCTVQADLPSDFYEMEHVEWDGHEIYPAPFDLFMSPETHSNWVDFYAIRDKTIFLAPSPSDRRLLKVRYRYFPASITLTGSSDTTSCPLPDEFNMCPVFYAVGMVLKSTFEFEESDKAFGAFYDQVSEYRRNEANQNVKLYPKNTNFYVPRVEY